MGTPLKGVQMAKHVSKKGDTIDHKEKDGMERLNTKDIVETDHYKAEIMATKEGVDIIEQEISRTVYIHCGILGVHRALTGEVSMEESQQNKFHSAKVRKTNEQEISILNFKMGAPTHFVCPGNKKIYHYPDHGHMYA